jgi:hypothetical protein
VYEVDTPTISQRRAVLRAVRSLELAGRVSAAHGALRMNARTIDHTLYVWKGHLCPPGVGQRFYALAPDHPDLQRLPPARGAQVSHCRRARPPWSPSRAIG